MSTVTKNRRVTDHEQVDARELRDMAAELESLAGRLNATALAMEHHEVESVKTQGLESYRRLVHRAFAFTYKLDYAVTRATGERRNENAKLGDFMHGITKPANGSLKVDLFLSVSVDAETGDRMFNGVAISEVAARGFSAYDRRFGQTHPVIVKTTLEVPCKVIPRHDPCPKIRTKAVGSRVLQPT